LLVAVQFSAGFSSLFPVCPVSLHPRSRRSSPFSETEAWAAAAVSDGPSGFEPSRWSPNAIGAPSAARQPWRLVGIEAKCLANPFFVTAAAVDRLFSETIAAAADNTRAVSVCSPTGAWGTVAAAVSWRVSAEGRAERTWSTV